MPADSALPLAGTRRRTVARLATGTAAILLTAAAVVSIVRFRAEAGRTAAILEAARQVEPVRILQQFVDECVLITPGTEPFPGEFDFGPVAADEFTDLKSARVALASAFRMSRYETTQELYEAVTGTNPARWKGLRNSVEFVTYEEAQAFCARLTSLLHERQLIDADEVVRLPTEPEWEYCCRAGTRLRYSFPCDADDAGEIAETLGKYAWHHGNAAGNDPAVGSLQPNNWGLYDMHGYLWEFVSDAWRPAGVTSETVAVPRVLRGGSWRDDPPLHTCAARMPVPPHAASDAIGFRCVIGRAP